jgi:phage gpG-like protein
MNAQWKGTRAELIQSLQSLPAVLSGRLPDPLGLGKVFFTHIGNAVLKLIQDDFLVKSKGGTGAGGVAWAPLKESTLERRRRKGIEHEEILKQTESLLESLTPDQNNAVDAVRIAGQVFEYAVGSITVGTDIPYADYHQNGTAYMPPRPIVPLSGDLPVEWESAVDQAIEEAFQVVIEIMVRSK